MVDFKKLMQDRYAKMTTEERKFHTRINKIREDNTFYKTIVKAENRYAHVHCGSPVKVIQLQAKVFRSVYATSGKIVIAPKLLLSFGDPCEYLLDKRFIRNWEEHGRAALCIDAGNELFIPEVEMRRIMGEIAALKLSLVEDYYKGG
jgi:hypothetical protein